MKIKCLGIATFLSMLFLGAYSYSKDMSCRRGGPPTGSLPPSLTVETDLMSTGALADADKINHPSPGYFGLVGRNLSASPSSLSALASTGGFPMMGSFKGNSLPSRFGRIPLENEKPTINVAGHLEDELRNILKQNETHGMTIAPSVFAGNMKNWPTILKGNAKTLKDAINSPKAADCSSWIVSSYQTEENNLKAISPNEDYESETKRYLDNQEMYKIVSGDKFEKVRRYVAALKKLLDSCYAPAEESAFVAEKSLLSRLGVIMLGERAICTGLLMGDGTYVLTARHCLLEASTNKALARNSLSDLWFRVSDGTDRHQVCAAVGKDILDNTIYTTKTDQVLLRISSGLPKQEKIQTVGKIALRAVGDDISNEDAPTLLVQISFLPLAKSIGPDKYKSGMVESTSQYCAVIATDTGCFVNTCSGLKGGSGAALFVAKNGPVIKLAGTFIGRGATNASDCTNERATYYNTAAYVNETLIAPFVDKQ